MKATIRKIGIIFLAVALASCAKDGEKGSESNGDEPKAEKGYATGKAVDTQGNPIVGAYLYLQNTLFYDSYINGTTSENGTYRLQLSPGAWKVHASFKKEYNGKTYTLRLHTDNTNSFSEEGGVRNATWKLEGRDPDPSYDNSVFYGGQVDISFYHTFPFEVQDKVEVTFTPSGPLIDGSEGKTLTLKPGDHYWSAITNRIEDIPIGRYMVTAVLKNTQGETPLKVSDSHTADDFAPEMQLDFISDSRQNFNPLNYAEIVISY